MRRNVARGKLASFLQQQGALIALVLVIIFAALRFSDRFLNITNLMNIPLQLSMVGLLALGMTFVILTGGIDLSVGSLVAVSAVVSAELSGQGLVVALLGGVAVSAILGLISGVVIAKGRIQPFIVTLAMMMAARGLVLVFTGEKSVRVAAKPSFISLAEGRIQIGALPLYYPVLILIFAYVAGWLVLKYTRFGRHVYSLGDNEEAARLMGLNVGRVTMGVYALSGALAGLAGVILAARQEGAGSPTSAVGWELDAIAAVVIGGTLLTGGAGRHDLYTRRRSAPRSDPECSDTRERQLVLAATVSRRDPAGCGYSSESSQQTVNVEGRNFIRCKGGYGAGTLRPE